MPWVVCCDQLDRFQTIKFNQLVNVTIIYTVNWTQHCRFASMQSPSKWKVCLNLLVFFFGIVSNQKWCNKIILVNFRIFFSLIFAAAKWAKALVRLTLEHDYYWRARWIFKESIFGSSNLRRLFTILQNDRSVFGILFSNFHYKYCTRLLFKT